jgi:uncharacterized protein (TIGR03067 family)
MAADASMPKDSRQAKEQARKEELKKLQGAWKAVSYESKSGKNSEPRAQLKIEKDAFSLWIGHGGARGTVVIDPAVKPKSWDFHCKGEEKAPVFRGIYELERETLRLCFGRDESKRPAAFPAKSGSKEDFSLYVFHRVKPKEEGKAQQRRD